MTGQTQVFQIITNVEATEDGYTKGWIVPAGTNANADLQLEAVDHIDVPTTEVETDWIAGLLAELAAAGYAMQFGSGRQHGPVFTATVTRA
jgi:hypothetical protein